jgi:uncharacterized protein YuzE
MKLNYYPDIDSLYIDLSEQPSVESGEISEGIVLDYDAAGNLVGIDIDNASRRVASRKGDILFLLRTDPGCDTGGACQEQRLLQSAEFAPT